ncbi:hypothetical protein V6N11_057340 [Hibiscus sabdariffa]|uniref:Syntaxin 6/10/61 N-terminal domain-containing protein n=1 Tax=Hibiscus sabdariffa TaxID=183260 RepID=A0ABR2N9N5_9ROSI
MESLLPQSPFRDCLDWLEEARSLLDLDQFSFLMVLLWNIWNRRNRWVHTNQLIPARLVSEYAQVVKGDFQHTNENVVDRVSCERSKKWRKPEPGQTKDPDCSVAATFLIETRAALSAHAGFTLQHVSREANRAAHMLAHSRFGLTDDFIFDYVKKMMVVNSFDLWQKDAFFSAAEEVQESADVMESAYRMWTKERRKGHKASDSAQLCRELQTALGTAKWQLEEFERAIKFCHGHHCDDYRASRHRQFIAAIEGQIHRVEAALKEAFIEEGKQPLRWVDLDEEECDDLAMFLSGTSPSLQPSKKNTLLVKRKNTDPNGNATCDWNMPEVKFFNDFGKDIECIIDIEEESSGKTDDVSSGHDRTNSSPRTWSSPNFGSLKIVIADEYKDRSQIRVEATPKEKGFKPFFHTQKCGELPQVKGAVNLFKQCFGCVVVLQRRLQSPVHLQFSCSLQLTLILMIAIFLMGELSLFGFRTFDFQFLLYCIQVESKWLQRAVDQTIGVGSISSEHENTFTGKRL